MCKTLSTGDISSERWLLIWYVKKGVAFSKALLEIQCILATWQIITHSSKKQPMKAVSLSWQLWSNLFFFLWNAPSSISRSKVYCTVERISAKAKFFWEDASELLLISYPCCDTITIHVRWVTSHKHYKWYIYTKRIYQTLLHPSVPLAPFVWLNEIR